MRQRLEYAAAWPFIKIMGVLPRPLARAIGMGLAWVIYLLHVRLRRVGMRNLALAFPEKTEAERARILRGEFASLGRQLAEVCHFPQYTLANVDQVVVYDGFENYERAQARGKGVLL
ncbi:MAG: lipid A biosynthesis acyltransferase, partial [Candidatus Sulfotelmatobacter sp.]